MLKNAIKITYYEKNWSSFAIIFHSTLNLWTVISTLYRAECEKRGKIKTVVMVTREAAYYNRELLAFDEFFFVCLIFARKKEDEKKMLLFKQVSFLEVHAAVLLAS